jgi:hypothetical protein
MMLQKCAPDQIDKKSPGELPKAQGFFNRSIPHQEAPFRKSPSFAVARNAEVNALESDHISSAAGDSLVSF